MKNDKPTRSMIALRRIPNSNRYGTRQLLAGDPFDATHRDAKVLIAAKLATRQRDIGKLNAPPLIVTDKISKADRKKHKVDPTDQPPAETQPQPETVDEAPAPADDTAAAREDYQAKVGKRPFMGWDAETIRAKMAENAPGDSADTSVDTAEADTAPAAIAVEPATDTAAS